MVTVGPLELEITGKSALDEMDVLIIMGHVRTLVAPGATLASYRRPDIYRSVCLRVTRISAENAEKLVAWLRTDFLVSVIETPVDTH